jgi:hypothetical protein
MRIQLELEDFRFCSTSGDLGNERWLVLELAGKKFYVRRNLDQFDQHRKDAKEAIDRMLIEHMQVMVETLLYDGAARCPDGEIQMRCASGELWRFHYERSCGCKVEEVSTAK